MSVKEEQVEDQVEVSLTKPEDDPRIILMEKMDAEKEARELSDEPTQEIEIEAPEAAIEPEKLDEPPVEKSETAPEKHKVKVDGEETEVTLDELKASYQKNAAATRRLQDAAQQLAAAKSAKEEAERIAEEAKSQLEAAKPGYQEKIKAALNSVVEGDIDSAAKHFEEALQKPEQKRPEPTFDKDSVVKEVEQRIQMSIALQQFQKDFPIISGDQFLEQRTMAFVQEHYDGSKPIADVLKAAGSATMNWLREKAGVPETPAGDLKAEKLEAKRKLEIVPKASAKVSAPQPDDEDDSPAQIIAQMKRARGQM